MNLVEAKQKIVPIVICLLAISNSAAASDNEVVPKVKTEIAKRVPITETFVYAGRIEPKQRSIQYPPFNGKLLKILKTVGSPLRQNEAVLTLGRHSAGQDFAPYMITSNLKGSLNKIFLKEGEEFTTATPLFEVITTSAPFIEIHISDRDRNKVWKGMEAEIAISSQTNVQGSLTKLPLAADKDGLFPVEITLAPNKKTILGQYAKVTLKGKTSKLILVDKNLPINIAGSPHIYVVSQEETITIRKIELGDQLSDQVVILSGLEENERFVIERNQTLSEGQKIKIKRPGPPTKNRKRS